jgi:hypothetical protein
MKRLFTLRALLWLLVSLVTVYALFVSIENWTGARALAAAKDRLAKEGETLDFALLLPPPIPDSQNFCAIEPLKGLTNPKLPVAAELEALNWSKKQSEWLQKHVGASLPQNLSCRLKAAPIDLKTWTAFLADIGIGKKDAAPAEMLAALDSAHPLLKRLSDEATLRTKAQFKPQIGEGQEKFTFFELQVPHLNHAQRLGRLLTLRAHFAIAAGNGPEALRSIQACLRLAEAVGEAPMLLGTLVSYTLHSMALEAVWALLHYRIATSTELELLSTEIQRADYLRMLLQAMRGELAGGVQTVEMMTQRPESRVSIMGMVETASNASGAPHEPSLSSIMGRLIPQGFFQHAEARMIELELEHLLLPMKRGGHAPLVESLALLEKEVAKSRELTNPHGWFAGLVLPAYSSVVRHVYLAETMRRLSLASIQIEKHRLANGTPPATLESRLLDPIDQKPLRYRVEGSGYVIWSIASDGEDDQGRALKKDEKENDARFGADWVWRMPGR